MNPLAPRFKFTLGLLIFSSQLVGLADGTPEEPVYQGKALSVWARDTLGQDIDGTPDADSRKAEAAVRAIGAEKAIPFLIEWLGPGVDSELPSGAKRCFQILGSSAKGAIPKLQQILNHPSRDLAALSARGSAAKSLSYLGPEAVQPLLSAALKEEDPSEQWEMIDYMANFGTNGIRLLPYLSQWSKNANEWVRFGAFEAYLEIQTNRFLKLEFAAAFAVNDASDLVQSHALDYLEQEAGQDQEKLSSLVGHLRHPESAAQMEDINDLVRSDSNKAAASAVIAQALNCKDALVRMKAANALGEIGDKSSLRALSGHTNEPSQEVREAVHRSLIYLQQKPQQ